GDLPMIMCYPGQLNQVFMNIISNAIDALNQQSIQGIQPVFSDSSSQKNTLKNYDKQQIEIQTQIINEGSILVQITDNGPGIFDHVREKLFDPFFTTKPIGKGTGLGLSVSYQIIVEHHRGKLWCESVPGQGTTFSIQIPINQSVLSS
ncbi:MAG: HAMP domain-containing histidine kinase, partial [Cyanothece sp. SIO2G6]|nr:HAMP domain-containing histidine kinase [Cyanothece sp. SIO2G6]